MRTVPKKYDVSSVFWTVQGEGVHTGVPTAVLKLAGCNLWSGLEADRDTAKCSLCDTDFSVLAQPEAAELAERVAECSLNGRLLITGGEPLLQLDVPLLTALRKAGISFIAVETNGTLPLSVSVRTFLNWVTVSPKCKFNDLKVTGGDELKIVFPDCMGDLWMHIGKELFFNHYLIQPCAGPAYEFAIQSAFEFVLQHPRWRLSLQTHKYLRLAPALLNNGGER